MLSDVCLTSVAYIVNIRGAHSYWKQDVLGAARPGVRRVWAGAGQQRAAYKGGDISWQTPAHSLFMSVETSEEMLCIICLFFYIHRM